MFVLPTVKSFLSESNLEKEARIAAEEELRFRIAAGIEDAFEILSQNFPPFKELITS